MPVPLPPGSLSPPLTEPLRSALQAALLDWARGRRAHLPWRGETDPYRIWVSEIMLQQTRTETAAPYYLRFLDRFPTVRSLAEAPLDDVLRLWEGLGYYSRARSLHAAAGLVVREPAAPCRGRPRGCGPCRASANTRRGPSPAWPLGCPSRRWTATDGGCWPGSLPRRATPPRRR